MFSAVVRTHCRSLALKNTTLSLQSRTLTRLPARSLAVRAFSSGLPRFEEQQPQQQQQQQQQNQRPQRTEGGSRQSTAPLVYRKPMAPSKSVYIGNLPYSIDENEIHRLFSQYGQIEDIRLGVFSSLSVLFLCVWSLCMGLLTSLVYEGTFPDGRLKGFAHIDFAEQSGSTALVDAQLAEPAFINNRQLRIDYAPGRTQIANPPHEKLFVSDFRGTQEDLHKAFAEYADQIISTQMRAYPFFFAPWKS